jgi:energy-coupling factor transporter ATP-binding protein EcfA2
LSNSGSDDSFVRPSVRITRIVFSSGQSLELNENDKVLLIGPNNAGKSKFLSEIAAYIESHADQRGVVVHEVHLDKKGRQSDLRQYLETAGEVFSNAYRLGNWEIGSNVIRHWDDTNHLPYGLAKGFFKLIKADDRLKICEQQQSVAPDDQKPKPQHILYHDSVLMDRVSALFEKAFGQSLMFNYRGGNRLPIHVGKLPDTSITGVDRVSDAYVAAVRNNPLLDQQGDGVKSYAGILFESIVSDYDIVALDEPEAFLHPPQMRRLAETLAVEVKKQLIVATHSSDIVRGFLQGSDGSVRVVRIRRSGKDNSITETAPETVRELWTRPELRYSNALDALFHDEVVICEDESDCKLYNAVADHIQSEANETWPDIAYVPSGGKHGAPKIAGVLHRMGVPVKQIYDIDFLSECDLVRASVLAVDGPWEEVAPPRNPFTSPRTFFALIRRSTDPRVGFVGRALLRHHRRPPHQLRQPLPRDLPVAGLRPFLHTWITTAPSFVQRRPASRLSRRFTGSGRLGERSASKRSSTALETLFTFCPPGPEARTKLSVISQSASVI